MDKVSDLIHSYFPVIGIDDAARLAAGFENLSWEELELLLHTARGAQKRGSRILLAYLESAPYVYGILDKNDFEEWLNLARNVSRLSISCCEGFFHSSLAILKKGGFKLLKFWTETGISVSGQNKWMAIAYFRYTGQVILSAGTEKFRHLVENGKKIGKVNVKVAETYFENLSELNSLLISDDFTSFCSITKKVIRIHWLSAIELINLTVKVLPDIDPERRKELLQAMNRIQNYGDAPTMALLENADTILKNTDRKKFAALMKTALDLAEYDKKSAGAFLSGIGPYAGKLEMEEVDRWKNKAMASLSSKDSLRAFISAVMLLGRSINENDSQSRTILADMGIRLTDMQPESAADFFENSPDAYSLLDRKLFGRWCETGEEISMQNPGAAALYYKSSVISLKKIPSEAYGEIFAIADILLEKEGSLTAVFFENLATFAGNTEIGNARRWAETGLKIYDTNRTLAIDYFSNSPSLLRKLDMDELEEWALKGLDTASDLAPAGKAYFSLESRSSNEYIEELTGTVALQKVANVLRYYAIGLSGSNFVIHSMESLPLQADPQEMNPLIAGNAIYLAPKMEVCEDAEDNFRIYKLSVMHEVGHLRFSSLDIPPETASALTDKLSVQYPHAVKEDMVSEGSRSNKNPDIVDILSLFPNRILAATIMGLLEDARVEYMIMEHYRGVRADLEDIRKRMLMVRPAPEKGLEEFMEALLWTSTGLEPVFKTDRTNSKLLEDIRPGIIRKLFREDSGTYSSLEFSLYIYSRLEEHYGPLEKKEYKMLRNIAYRGMDIGAAGSDDPMMTRPAENVIRNFIPQTEADLTAEQQRPRERETDRPDRPLDKNWKVSGSYRYDEWDSLINDYRSGWSTVNEIEPVGGSTKAYYRSLERYSYEISLLKTAFSMIKPEAFHRVKERNDGTEIDIDAVIESLIAKKCGINSDEGLYIRMDKHERDVATLFLLDVSASTKKVLGTDGRRILDVEKDALIIMSQALESIGDDYAIYAFSGKSREDVEYFVIKDLDEKLSDNVARRLSLLQPASNTRLGPAIRHSIKKLESTGAKTKLLILLSDGEPYDRSRGEDSYQGIIAQEDTRVAIGEGKNQGIHFFCITVDRNPGAYLDNIFSDIGYTIIDDVLMLPEILPLLYKRLTT